MDELAGREGWRVITGDTPVDERTAIVEAFQAGELRGVAGTIQAMGVGITLTRSHTVLFVDLDWTPALNSQMEDRVCRIGQTRGVHIVRLECNHPLDQRVNTLLLAKQALIEASVDETIGADHTIETPNGVELHVRTDRATFAAGPAHAMQVDVVSAHPPSRYRAQTSREKWAWQGLCTLVDCDADRATAPNGMGFSRLDSALGHSLHKQHEAQGGLTVGQWKLVASIVSRYPRQVGRYE